MIIIGSGRVGGALAQRAAEAGAACTLVTRDAGWPQLEQSSAPIFVAVRNDDLDAVVERTPSRARERLVFTQNGMLRPWLRQRGLANNTRGLLFFAVPRRGAVLEPGGDSPFRGPHAQAVVNWLGRLGVPASVAGSDSFAETELEKLLWNCCFGLLCEHTGKPVGGVVDEHDDVLTALAEELLEVGMPAFDLELDTKARADLIERLRAYSRSIPTYRGAVKEWPWRNGWFVKAASRAGLHARLLQEAGH